MVEVDELVVVEEVPAAGVTGAPALQPEMARPATAASIMAVRRVVAGRRRSSLPQPGSWRPEWNEDDISGLNLTLLDVPFSYPSLLDFGLGRGWGICKFSYSLNLKYW